MAAEWREVHCATAVKLLAGLMICPTRRFRFYSGRIVALRWALAGETLARERRFPPKRDVSIKILQRQLNVGSRHSTAGDECPWVGPEAPRG